MRTNTIVTTWGESKTEVQNYLKYNAPLSTFTNIGVPQDNEIEGNYVFKAAMTSDDITRLSNCRDIKMAKLIGGDEV